MEALKNLFGERALTFDELSEALQGSKDIKLANLATGQYVDKAKYAQLEAQLAEHKSSHAAEVKALGEQLGMQQKNACVELALTKAQAKNLIAAKALLRMDEIRLEGGKLSGLDEQLQTVVRENPFLFGEAPPNPPPPLPGGTGFTADDTARWRNEAGLPPA